MENSLRSHLIYLNERLQELADSLNRPITPGERDSIAAQVELAQQALDNYRRAFEIEYAIQNVTPDPENAQQK
jgi:hypothetical protein